MNGSALQSKIIKHLERKYGAYCINVVEAGQGGTPDLVASIGGIFYGFEVKGQDINGKYDIQRELQKVALQEISESGGYSGFVYSVADVENIIKNKLRYRIP